MPDFNLPTGLYWQGKRTEVERISLPFQTIETINESRATREKEKDSLLKGLKKKEDPVWYNRLIWGDNKYVMSSLLDEFAGKIDLIYIDPPFATGADFSVKIEVGDVKWTKEPSVIEEKAYRDTWGKGLDSYLQMMYDRLVLMRDLLSEKGSIYVHLDWHVGHYVKVIMDEIFGKENFRNEIVWYYGERQLPSAKKYNAKHDIIFFYSKGEEYIFNMQFKSHDVSYISNYFKFGYCEKCNYEQKWNESGICIKCGYKLRRFQRRGKSNTYPEGRQYLDETPGVAMDTVWDDISAVHSRKAKIEQIGFDTQKPATLLKRIIKTSSNPGDLVADFFCGSGTTGAVAEKLGRRWIMCDIGRYAIHTTRKRLLDIEGCKPFVIQNLGKYERQYWQGVTFEKSGSKSRLVKEQAIYEYIKFILELYHAEPVTGCMWIHGKKGKSLVHVGSVDAPVTLYDIEQAIDECKKLKQSSLDILGWEWEMGLHDVVQALARSKGVKLYLKYIPREVMDPRAVAAGDITFYELAYLDVDVHRNKYGEFVVELKDFVIPNLDLIPEDVRSKIKKWSDYIDYWSIDWDYKNDTFHNMWQSYRTKKDRTLQLKSDPYKYDTKGKHLIMIKVIDIFGNDTTRLIEVVA